MFITPLKYNECELFNITIEMILSGHSFSHVRWALIEPFQAAAHERYEPTWDVSSVVYAILSKTRDWLKKLIEITCKLARCSGNLN